MIKLDKKGLTQWDVGRYFNVSGVKEVHIANAGDSKAVVLSVADGKVPIPCFLLTTGKNVLAYAVDKGITVARYSFPVERKQRPENYVYEDDQRNYIYELISRAEKAANDSEALVAEVSAAVDRADAAVENADAAASRAEVSAEDAHIAAGKAEIAAAAANGAAKSASSATSWAENAADGADSAASRAIQAAVDAEEATTSAVSAAVSANNAAASINKIAGDISATLDAIISIQEELIGGEVS